MASNLTWETGSGSSSTPIFGSGFNNAAKAASAPTLQGGEIATDLGTIPNLTSLTQLLNQINVGSQTSANAARVPNNPALESQSSANIGSELNGQLPPDVAAQISQQGAERGISTGSPGSDNANAAMLRALGLTSLGEQQVGQQNLSAADARNPVAPVINSSYFAPGASQLTPQSNTYGGATYPAQAPYTPPAPAATPATANTNWWDSLFGDSPFASSGTVDSSGLPVNQPNPANPEPGLDTSLFGGTDDSLFNFPDWNSVYAP